MYNVTYMDWEVSSDVVELGVIPLPTREDSHDVVEALSTASSMWRRHERTEAMAWLQRAATTSAAEGWLERAQELANAVEAMSAFSRRRRDQRQGGNGGGEQRQRGNGDRDQRQAGNGDGEQRQRAQKRNNDSSFRERSFNRCRLGQEQS